MSAVKRKRTWAILLVLYMALSLLPLSAFAADGDTITVGVIGEYITQAQDALDLINQYRYEACQEGVKAPGTGKPLTLEDYVPIKWSSDLEYIARIRAADACVEASHARPNGQRCFTVTSPGGVSSHSEVLAWNYGKTMTQGVEQWYREKADWVGQTGKVAGHYTAMIDPDNLYVGLSTFYSPLGAWPNTTSGEFSRNSALDETMNATAGSCVQAVEVSSNKVSAPAISGDAAIKPNEQTRLTLTVSVNSRPGYPLMGEATWTSGNSSVAVVDKNGLVTGIRNGTAVITASASGLSANISVVVAGTVDCAETHTFDNGIVTRAATCKEEGVRTFVCALCGATENRAIPKTEHTWNTGTVTKEATNSAEGVRTFLCTVCGTAKTETIPMLSKPGASGKFTDVAASAYYYDAVQWAVGKNVAAGTSTTTFSPDDACTRGQVMTFLWRAKGSPEPKASANPFADVSPGDYYYKAILWAAENEITTGTSASTFSPGDACTRGQVVTFLWRAEGSPGTSSTSNPFVDVSPSDYYCKAVLWAVKENITSGSGPTAFSSNSVCSRGQIVTFLWRSQGE